MLPTQSELRYKSKVEEVLCPPFVDIDIVFLAGGTCKIPFVQGWIRKQFPNAKMVIDEQLETITATGAAVHALQVLNLMSTLIITSNRTRS